MTASVQSAATGTAESKSEAGSARTGIDHQPVTLYAPGALTSDAELAAYLARGRALQSRALRRSFAAAIRPVAGVFGSYGRLRQRYARIPVRPYAAS